MMGKIPFAWMVLVLLRISFSAVAQEPDEPLTIYSGRREELVAPIIEQFTEDTGIEVEVRYGSMAEMVITILEEGDNSPADVFFVQDSSGLGALAHEGRLAPLPDEILSLVPARYQSPDGVWVGTSGRARVLLYNTELVDEANLPDSLLDLTDARWRGQVGWAPTNGPFQGQVTALRVLLGEETARAWLEGMLVNDTVAYADNSPLVQAVSDGEVTMGLVNHYYLYETLAENPDAPIANHFFADGDVGALVNVAGAGVVDTSDQPELAQQFIAYLLTDAAQAYFATQTYEYPLVTGVDPVDGLMPLDELVPPELDLGDLSDLEGTLALMRDVGVLP